MFCYPYSAHVLEGSTKLYKTERIKDSCDYASIDIRHTQPTLYSEKNELFLCFSPLEDDSEGLGVRLQNVVDFFKKFESGEWNL